MTYHYCSGRVPDNSGRTYPCSKAGKVERDGKSWCSAHDPEKVRARRDKTQQRYEAENAYRRAKEAVAQAERNIVEACIARSRELPVWLQELGESARAAQADASDKKVEMRALGGSLRW